jgi:hypothetical protein
MRTMLGVMLALCSGCAQTVSVSFQVSSSQQYKVPERPAVWNRAVSAFQLRSNLIGISDPVSGLLRTESQPGWLPCGNTPDKACTTTEQVQLTIGSDGTALLRRYITATGKVSDARESPFLPNDMSVMQQRTDALLAYIVGTSPVAPEPPPPAPPGVPAR